MRRVRLAAETDFEGWRAAARALRLSEVPPEDVAWSVGGEHGLFDSGDPLPAPPPGASFSAPAAFLDLARDVVLHANLDRFALLYRMLWRLRDQPNLIHLLTDADVASAFRMQKAVFQAIHKMHAFVRFRVLENAADETYVAWFEPPHFVIERGSPFFVKRMANLRFSIIAPYVSAHWDGQALSFGPGGDPASAPAFDDAEEQWRAYYASVFNPARLNPRVMAQHMPRAYWKNLPEAALIPALTAAAQGRTETMVHASPTTPSPRAMKAAARRARDEPDDTGVAVASLEDVAAGVQHCRRCDLWRNATQGVPGEGPARAKLMFVGEQPGDMEDLAGRAFVGPAGQLLDRALAEAGIDRADCYVTNAVKHFKHEMRGKRRLHKTPNAGEVRACRWWLDNERRLVKPKVIVALGSTAGGAVFGRPVSVMRERGPGGRLEGGAAGFITVHPSFLLRVPDEASKRREYAAFVADLRAARELLGAHSFVAPGEPERGPARQ